MLPYFLGYKTGLSLSRMSTNNQISPMQCCCNTGFTLPKQAQRSRSILYDGSRFLGLFWNNPRDLDLSYKMDLDFWDCFGRKKTVLYAKKYGTFNEL